jgi:replicative DNA helicase
MNMDRRQFIQNASGLAIPEIKPVEGPTPNSRFLDTLNILLPTKPRNAHYPQDPVEFVNKVLGLDTWWEQDRIIRAVWDNRYTSVASCHGIGKGLTINTPIPTPYGWTTMGDVSVGDEVFDESGNVCRVTAVSPINRIDCYRVTFSDGSSLVADKDHLWGVLRFRWRGTHRQALRQGGVAPRVDWRTHWDAAEVLSTPQLAEATQTPWGQRDASIPTPMPLSLPETNLPIDPYILGCWLGDGTSAAPQLTSADQGIVQEIERRGWRVRKLSSKYLYYLGTGKRGESVRLLRGLGVLNNKHIPVAYLRASESQRRDLLAGLLDTDGFVGQGNRVGIDLCDERLARGAAELIRSLGYVVNVKVGVVNFSGKQITRWRMSFTPESSPFILARKSEKFSPGSSQFSRMTHRMVVSVDPVPSAETRCIAVDSPRNLYLVGEQMIPTHNSTISAALALTFLHLHENSIVLSTAPTGRQVEHVLWRNIRVCTARPASPSWARNRSPSATTSRRSGTGWASSPPTPSRTRPRDSTPITSWSSLTRRRGLPSPSSTDSTRR